MKKILVCRETDPRETRTPLIPEDVKRLVAMGYEIKAVRGTGLKSGFSDEAYEKADAVLVDSNEEGYKGSEIVLRIMKPESIEGIESGTLHLSYLDPWGEKEL
ncbi:MAG: NAD(P)(+) transhydrogenase (Re/Si-specific) subunit alpha, partial [Ruminococcus sp.]|nr:NAD(P)(+) transhydrogenase (Re/Si-specific) subunit alpha [Ruminococcus sp.]